MNLHKQLLIASIPRWRLNQRSIKTVQLVLRLKQHRVNDKLNKVE